MIVPQQIGLAALVAIATAAPVCAQSGPDIPFALDEDTSLKDPDNPEKKFRIDFARVEAEVPLTRQHLMNITPENIKTLSQERVDQIYGRLTAGPIPDASTPAICSSRAATALRRKPTCARGSNRFLAGSKGGSPAAGSRYWKTSAASSGRARCSSASNASCAT